MSSEIEHEDAPRGVAKHPIAATIIAGALLISAPLLFEAAVLSQPQCAVAVHPHLRDFVEVIFDLVGKIGDACIIAGLIGVAVDQGLKTRFIQEVVRAASPKLIGRHLPDPLREALLTYFRIHFVRPEWEIEYEITKVDEFPNFVMVTSRIQGIVQNCSSDSDDFPFAASIDPSPLKNGQLEALITRVTMKPEAGNGGFDEFPPDKEKLVQPDGTKLFERKVTMPAGSRYKTVLEATEYRPTASVMPLFTGTAVVKSTVTIRYPKDWLDIQVSTGTSANLPAEPTPWGHRWPVTLALLPGQCIVATWNPKGKPGAGAVAQPPAAPAPAAASSVDMQVEKPKEVAATPMTPIEKK